MFGDQPVLKSFWSSHALFFERAIKICQVAWSTMTTFATCACDVVLTFLPILSLFVELSEWLVAVCAFLFKW